MSFRLHQDHVHVGDLTNFLLKLIICCLLENYWVNPFPGASFEHQSLLFVHCPGNGRRPSIRARSTILLQILKTAGDNTAMPSFTAPLRILCYVVVQLMLGLASAILFVINCSSFILYGVTALFGPVFIPLLMTKNFRAKFFHFLDVLISFAMIRARCRCIYLRLGRVHERVLFSRRSTGNYSMEMWMGEPHPVLDGVCGVHHQHALHPQHDAGDLWRRRWTHVRGDANGPPV